MGQELGLWQRAGGQGHEHQGGRVFGAVSRELIDQLPAIWHFDFCQITTRVT